MINPINEHDGTEAHRLAVMAFHKRRPAPNPVVFSMRKYVSYEYTKRIEAFWLAHATEMLAEESK
jgi:hypothetical protein